MTGYPIPDDAPGNYGHQRHRLDCEPDPRAEEWRDLIEYVADDVPYSERVRANNNAAALSDPSEQRIVDQNSEGKL